MNGTKLNRMLLTTACTASGLAALGAGTCIVDMYLNRTACSMMANINGCPVIPAGIDGHCGEVALSTAGFTKSDPYKQDCSYQLQKRNQAGDCEPIHPPVYGIFTQQCHRTAGDACKKH